MPRRKRIFDLVVTALISTFLLPILGVVLLVALVRHGRPLFFVSERMMAPGRPFSMYKLRTMAPDPQDDGVSGGDKTGRITPFGRLLRRARLDEIPQLLNIVRGDMSLVGPRPPLRRYVEQFPQLYAQVLQTPPGGTGLASLVFARHEERLLARCLTAEETEATYVRRCIPRKARLDLIYLGNWSLRLDLWLMVVSGARAMRLPWAQGRRLPRRSGGRRSG